jgi:hypothetical protein
MNKRHKESRIPHKLCGLRLSLKIKKGKETNRHAEDTITRHAHGAQKASGCSIQFIREKCGISACRGALSRKSHVGRTAMLELIATTALNTANRRIVTPLKYLKSSGKNRKGRKITVNKLEETTHIVATADMARLNLPQLTRYRSKKKNAVRANNKATIVVI